MDQTTHYIDGSQIYGISDLLAADLRAFEGGRLKSEIIDDKKEFCP